MIFLGVLVALLQDKFELALAYFSRCSDHSFLKQNFLFVIGFFFFPIFEYIDRQSFTEANTFLSSFVIDSLSVGKRKKCKKLGLSSSECLLPASTVRTGGTVKKKNPKNKNRNK